MEFIEKPLTEFLAARHEYTYQEVFDVFVNNGRADCKIENERIAVINQRNETAADHDYEVLLDEYRESVQLEEQTVIAKHRSSRNRYAWLIFFVSLAAIVGCCAVLANIPDQDRLEVLICVLIPALLLCWLVVLLKPQTPASALEKPVRAEIATISDRDFVYTPIGTVQCSSCATKTRIESKTSESNCPNCHSEILVISKMETDVELCSLMRSIPGTHEQ